MTHKVEIKSLRVSQKEYGNAKGKYIGSIAFESDHGKVDFKLTDDHIQRIFHVVSDRLIEVAQEVALDLQVAVGETAQEIKDQLEADR